jgi:predicted TPR repeat methyltransferase
MSVTADTPRLLRRVHEMIDRGRLTGARPLLAALKSLPGAQAGIAEAEARLLLREGRQEAALELLDGAIAQFPAERALHVCRADARMQANDAMGAAGDAASAVLMDRTDPVAKAMLGIALIDLGRLAEAAACLHEAVQGNPANAAFRCALATACERSGDADSAAAVLAEGVRYLPADVSLRTAAIMVEMRRRAFAQAADLAEAARQDGAIDACVMGLLGHALSSLGRHAEAADAYGEALKLGPEDPYVRHLVAAAGVLPQAQRAPGAYLEAVFDGYAPRFEAHLISLGYRAPGLLRAALLAHLPAEAGAPLGPVLDLGCGTGLIGVVLSDLALGGLVGVDASERMLDEARHKGLYAELIHDDLEAMLHRTTATWPVVIAADVLCYFGALGAVMAAVHARMPPGGLFLFTVEELPPDGPDGSSWQLGRQGRYAHQAAHVRASALAAGFQLRELRRETLRYEADAPVDGLLVVLQRTRHDG